MSLNKLSYCGFYRNVRPLLTSFNKLSINITRTNCTAVEGDTSQETSKTFQKLLDESLLTKFGRPDNKCLVGKITDVCNDDLYVDFGGKFEAVLKRPEEKSTFYKKGALVRILLRKFEMTGSFLGDARHITLCEADAFLLGPYTSQFEQKRKHQRSSTSS